MTRRRLEPHQRRDQLLDVGAAMFAGKAYADVFVEAIAARVGVSRSTLYHYFPSKRDLYVGIFKRASTRLLAHVNPDPQLPLADQLAAGLEAHIQYLADHPFEAIAIRCGALSDDPAVQAIVTDELNVIGQRLIDKLVTEGHLRDVTEVAVEGWLAFVRAACVKWVQSHKIMAAELTEMCLRAFNCALLVTVSLNGDHAARIRHWGSPTPPAATAWRPTPSSDGRTPTNSPPPRSAPLNTGTAPPHPDGHG